MNFYVAAFTIGMLISVMVQNFNIQKQAKAVKKLIEHTLLLAQQAELIATQRDLVSLEEVVSIKEAQGLVVSQRSLDVIESVKRRIEDLRAELKLRRNGD